MQPPFSWKSFSPSTRNKNLRAGTRVLWMCFTLANVISCRLGVQKMSLCTSVQPQCTVCGLQSGKIAPNIVRADESERNQLCSTQDIWTLAVLDCSCDLYISFIAMVWDTLRCQVAFAVEETSKCYKHHGKKCKPESLCLKTWKPRQLTFGSFCPRCTWRKCNESRKQSKYWPKSQVISTQMMNFLFTW